MESIIKINPKTYLSYHMEIGAVKRELPICKVNDRLYIAAFVIFGDVELTRACAEETVKLLPEHDVLITAESKGIPLIYEMARILGEPKYLVARKMSKLYMKDPQSVEVQSITTEKLQKLFLDRDDAEYMNGKRVVIVDDVISTGESISAVEKLVTSAGGIVVGRCAVLAEGDAAERSDISFVKPLPLFIPE